LLKIARPNSYGRFVASLALIKHAMDSRNNIYDRSLTCNVPARQNVSARRIKFSATLRSCKDKLHGTDLADRILIAW